MRTRQIQITRVTVAVFALATCLFFLASRTEAAPPFNGKIAFESNRTGNNEIFSMNPDGTNPVQLTIAVMNADGSGVTRLTTN